MYSFRENDHVFQKILKLYEKKKFKFALDECFLSLNSDPKNFLLLNLSGVILKKLNKIEEALNQFYKAIQAKDDFIDAIYNLATCLMEIGQLKKAEEYFLRCLEINPNNFDCIFNLAECYRKNKNYEKSLKFFNTCLEKKKNDFELLYNIGLVYFDYENFDKAIEYFHRTLEIEDNFLKAKYFLALSLQRKERNDEAVSILESFEITDPNFLDLNSDLAYGYIKCHRYIDAFNLLSRQNLEKNKSIRAQHLLADLSISLGLIKEGRAILKECILKRNNDTDLHTTLIFSSNYLLNFKREDYFKETKNFIKILKKKNFLLSKKESTEKIRIAFLSQDFRNHAVMHQIFNVIVYLSSYINFSIFLYSTLDPKKEDDITTKLKSLDIVWSNLYDLSSDLISERISNDKIQILFDLSGFTTGNRLEVFFQKPAPIQITWGGYAASTGIKEIDYIIVDNVIAAKENGEQFVEKPLIVDKVWTVLSDKTIKESTLINEEIAFFKNNFFTFGSFNNISKINDQVIETWSNILLNTKNSKLILISTKFFDEKFKKIFLNKFIMNKVSSDQLILKSYMDRKNLLQLYNQVDLSLDTFPYNGGTTTLESYFMCTPVLTIKGNSFISCCGQSINTAIGLNDLVAKNNKDYLDKAIKYYNNPEELQKIKKYIFENKKKFPIFNTEAFSEKLCKILENLIKKNKIYA